MYIHTYIHILATAGFQRFNLEKQARPLGDLSFRFFEVTETLSFKFRESKSSEVTVRDFLLKDLGQRAAEIASQLREAAPTCSGPRSSRGVADCGGLASKPFVSETISISYA